MNRKCEKYKILIKHEDSFFRQYFQILHGQINLQPFLA